jgi:predicted Na+-dependent transporter
MGLLQRAAAGLAWLGRHGTVAVAISILLGIALPPLGALIRPFFPETVFALLCLAFLRVDPGALRAQFARPRLLAAAALWTMLVVPVTAGLLLTALDLGAYAPALLLALMLNVVAPPIFSSPALAALMGLNAATTLALLLACTAATPFLAPALVAAFVGPAVTFSPLALGLRLVLMLAGAACVAIAIRAIAGKPWVERQAERIDGLNVIAISARSIASARPISPPQPSGRGSARGRRSRRRLDGVASRCDGRTFRSEHHVRPGCDQGARCGRIRRRSSTCI